MPGIQVQSFFQGGDGGLGLLLDQQHFAQHLLQLRIFGTASQGLAHRGQGLVRLLLILVEAHQELQGRQEIRLFLQGLVGVLQSFIRLLGL